jgi:hypothetical protein
MPIRRIGTGDAHNVSFITSSDNPFLAWPWSIKKGTF